MQEPVHLPVQCLYTANTELSGKQNYNSLLWTLFRNPAGCFVTVMLFITLMIKPLLHLSVRNSEVSRAAVRDAHRRSCVPTVCSRWQQMNAATLQSLSEMWTLTQNPSLNPDIIWTHRPAGLQCHCWASVSGKCGMTGVQLPTGWNVLEWALST